MIKNADVVLTVAAVGGLITTTVIAVKTAPKYTDILGDLSAYKDAVQQDYRDELITKDEALYRIDCANRDAAKDLAFASLPLAVSLTATGICIVAPTKINRTIISGLTTSLNGANLAYNELRSKTREIVGEAKEREIHDAIEEKHTMRSCEIIPLNDIYQTGNGNTLCRIELVPGIPESGILFYSDPQAIHAAVNNANAEGLETGYVSLADLLYFMNLKVKHSGCQMRGWRVCSRDDFISIRESSYIHPTTGQPVLDISFWNNPYEKFDRFG